MKRSDFQGAGMVLVHYAKDTGAVIALAFPPDASLLAAMKAGQGLAEVAAQVPLPDGADSYLIFAGPTIGTLPDVPHVHWRVIDGAVVAPEEKPTTMVAG